jgi:hypothetical protein
MAMGEVTSYLSRLVGAGGDLVSIARATFVPVGSLNFLPDTLTKVFPPD